MTSRLQSWASSASLCIRSWTALAIAASGLRSSWASMARNSSFRRISSATWSSAFRRSVTSRKTSTTPSTAPPGPRMGGAAIVDRAFGAVARDEQSMIGQADDHSIGQHAPRRALDRMARVLVDDAEDVVEPPAGGLGAAPPAERLGNGIHEEHSAATIGRDHRVADARQHGGEPHVPGLHPSTRGVERLDEHGDHRRSCHEQRERDHAGSCDRDAVMDHAVERGGGE